MKAVEQIVREPAPHWVGDGFPVRSLFSYANGNQYDPFLLLDYAGPFEFEPGQAKRGVDEHPHKGFETVTIVYQGELEHGDSSGSHGTIGPGDVQWMTAGSGIVHEEFHSRRFTEIGGTLEMVQLWVNLPSEAKKSPPGYQEIRNQQIPSVALPNGAGVIRVIAGDYHGTRGPARTFTLMLVCDVRLKDNGHVEFEIPDSHTAAIVVQSGSAKVNDRETADSVSLVRFGRSGSAIALHALGDARILLLAGAPIGEPVVGQGPFVMNTQSEIREAIRDYQSGKMGRVSRT